ncbi:MAG TPA: M48 family metallopeptidase [Terriglobales bacterium]
MTRWIAFIGIIVAGLAAVFISERGKVDVEASPAAILYFVADAEREITRIPMQMTRMSDADEISAGNELARQYESPFQLSEDDLREEQYIQQVGERAAEHAHRRLPYQFHYIPDANFINAFALPGGHVFIGKGLVSLMGTEDELAAVLGHEVEHIDQRHCAERTQQEQIFRKIPLGELAEIPVEVFEAGYTKMQELEADREGTQLAVAAGYSSSGAIHMFETFERLEQRYSRHAATPGQEMSQIALETLEGYFRSHPLPEERITQLEQMHLPTHAEQPLKIRPAVIKP